MAAISLSNPRIFRPSLPSSSSSSPSPIFAQKNNVRGVGQSQTTIVCKVGVNNEVQLSPPILSKRSLSISLTTSFLLSLVGRNNKNVVEANAAILEADDDLELLEKVKQERKKRIERQGVLSSSKKETEYLQDAIYKLSKVGQAIEKNDLPSASSVLGQTKDADWVQKVNAAFTKLSSSPEDQTEVDTFNSSLSSLISSVTGNDIEASKLAFVSSASALEKWATLTGLIGKLKGL